MNLWIIGIVALCGAAGEFVNVFIGDSGLHLPKVENDVFDPGFVGVVFVGMAAAVAAWASLNTGVLIGKDAVALTLSGAQVANAMVIGFGGAKWWKSEGEKDVLQKTAGIAAGKSADPQAASTIATATPLEALDVAMKMK
jgi:hypothetical protein